MKKLFLFFLLFSMHIFSFAQDNDYYALTKPGASLQYSLKYKNNLMGYIVKKINDKKVEGSQTIVTDLLTMLNKKEQPSKNAAFAGYSDGLLSSTKLDNGSYYMTQDVCLACGGEDRHGYILKMPSTIKVGDEIEGGILNFSMKFPLTPTAKNELTYKNFKVVEELDLTTPAGVFHCLKITGNVTGKYLKMDINDHQVWYISKGLGIVREESYYLGEKQPIVLEVYKTSGL